MRSPETPSPTTTDDTAHPRDAAPARLLRVLSGVHAGAARRLGPQETLLVGRGDDCDVVLSDPDVAPHHALLTVNAATVSLRAIDAPVRLPSQLLHPGEPVQLGSLQAIGLGGASIAVGAEDDAAWSTLAGHPAAHASARPRASTRWLPLVAAVAALSLVSVAIFAAVVSPRDVVADPLAQVGAVVAAQPIADASVVQDADGSVRVSGVVADAATRQRVEARLRASGAPVQVQLRTGDDIAADVREVFRSEGLVARTRWLGNGDVEVAGRFEDEARLREVAQSRAMRDIDGVRRVVPRNLAPATAAARGPGLPAPPAPAFEIAAIVHGEDPHVVALDGQRYRIGDLLPGNRKLVAIGRQAWVDSNGQIVPLQTASRARADATGARVPLADAAPRPAPGRLNVAPGRTSVRM